MTRYTPIMVIVLVWQLLMPILCHYGGFLCLIALFTAIVFIYLSASNRWMRNSYSAGSAVAVVVLSLTLASVSGTNLLCQYVDIVQIFWLYALIAFTATSPYPLSIRMPMIVYTLALAYMIPQDISTLYIILGVMIFATVMGYLTIRWRIRTGLYTIAYGPKEPPFSMSLAIAIVLAVFINLCHNVADYYTASSIPSIVSLSLLSVICICLLLTKDWKKNILAVTALILMITVHVVMMIEYAIEEQWMRTTVFILSVSPVMFHTTAPVFRGMRIAITLYAVYSAFNRQHLMTALSDSSVQLWQQHAVIIGIDVILTLTLLVMAIHWKKN